MKRLISLPCLWCLLLFFASISLPDCSAADIISITEPVQDPNFIVSAGGTFKLGFFSPVNTTKIYLGIRYNNVPGLSVVWVANRDKPLNGSSGVLTISEDGNLLVMNGKKEILWSSNASNATPNSTAQLLDNGNLVLRDSSSGTSVWESFQIPTDTFLPEMRIGVSEKHTIQLASWRSPSDPSTGSFTYGLNPIGISELFVWNRGVPYWRSGPWNGNTFIGVSEMGIEDRSRYDDMEEDSAEAEYFTYDDTNTTSLLHYQLNISGGVQGKVLNEKGDWDVVFSSVASECDVYGKCGLNGICDPKALPICSCLKGFEPRDEKQWSKEDWSGGCIRKTPLQCNRNSSAAQQGEEDGFSMLRNVKVPDLSNYIATSERQCGNECLKNCFCSAYTFIVGIGCLQWNDSLIDIQQFTTRGSDLYVRVAYSELGKYADSGMSMQKKKVIIAITATVGCILISISLYYILCKWLLNHQVFSPDMMLRANSDESKMEELPLYSYETLANATDNFCTNNKLGRGGFGPVYKGKLLTGQEIAVKRLSKSSSQGIKEFMNEVVVISKLQHRNLVKILGCCVERGEKMLVYEYMPNKSLDSYLYDSRNQDLLDWNRRWIIIEGISRGLLYLHRDSRLRIIHRDLKASNILLDEELKPKISDFGLARIFFGKQDEAKTNRVVGTYGYMAPEYAMGGNFSEKSDVYSFGVLLLEIVSGKRNTTFYLDEENLSLLGYAWKLRNENKAVNLAFTLNLDPSIEMEFLRCVHIGLLCVQEPANDRPNMFDVLLMLNSEILELPQPKIPAYTARLSHFQDQCCPQSVLSVNDVSLTDVQGR